MRERDYIVITPIITMTKFIKKLIIKSIAFSITITITKINNIIYLDLQFDRENKSTVHMHILSFIKLRHLLSQQHTE